MKLRIASKYVIKVLAGLIIGCCLFIGFIISYNYFNVNRVTGRIKSGDKEMLYIAELKNNSFYPIIHGCSLVIIYNGRPVNVFHASGISMNEIKGSIQYMATASGLEVSYGSELVRRSMMIEFQK